MTLKVTENKESQQLLHKIIMVEQDKVNVI